MPDIYKWPEIKIESDLDKAFFRWSELVKEELETVKDALHRPLPDDPVQLDKEVTTFIEGWLPRVASLATTAEFFLSQAKLEKLPDKIRTGDGKPVTTEADRAAQQEAALGQYRFVRDLLDAYVNSMRDRMRWAQSVRKTHAEVQVYS